MTRFSGADKANGPGPNWPSALGRNGRRPWAELDNGPGADSQNGPNTAHGPSGPTALGRMEARPWAETDNGPEIKTDITGPIGSTARGPRRLTALGRTGPSEPTAPGPYELSALGPEPGRTGRRPRAVTNIGPVFVLETDADDLVLGHLPGVYPYGTWRYDRQRHTLYSGHYFGTYEEACRDLAKRSRG